MLSSAADPRALPTAIGKVNWIVASQNRSFCLGEAVRSPGALVNDGGMAIAADSTGESPDSSPDASRDPRKVDGAPSASVWERLRRGAMTNCPWSRPSRRWPRQRGEETTSERRDNLATSKIKIAEVRDDHHRRFRLSGGEPGFPYRTRHHVDLVCGRRWVAQQPVGACHHRESTIRSKSVTFAFARWWHARSRCSRLRSTKPGQPVKILPLDLSLYQGKIVSKGDRGRAPLGGLDWLRRDRFSLFSWATRSCARSRSPPAWPS
jgi:hypothetical protein